MAGTTSLWATAKLCSPVTIKNLTQSISQQRWNVFSTIGRPKRPKQILVKQRSISCAISHQIRLVLVMIKKIETHFMKILSKQSAQKKWHRKSELRHNTLTFLQTSVVESPTFFELYHEELEGTTLKPTSEIVQKCQILKRQLSRSLAYTWTVITDPYFCSGRRTISTTKRTWSLVLARLQMKYFCFIQP